MTDPNRGGMFATSSRTGPHTPIRDAFDGIPATPTTIVAEHRGLS